LAYYDRQPAIFVAFTVNCTQVQWVSRIRQHSSNTTYLSEWQHVSTLQGHYQAFVMN